MDLCLKANFLLIPKLNLTPCGWGFSISGKKIKYADLPNFFRLQFLRFSFLYFQTTYYEQQGDPPWAKNVELFPPTNLMENM